MGIRQTEYGLYYVLMSIKKNNREKGNSGENIACIHLIKQGFSIKDRNYLKKWGELDIVAVKDGILHFIEVKSAFDKGNSLGYRPEENVNNLKQKKLRRIIQTYLNEHKYGIDVEFIFDVITVVTNIKTGESEVKMLENIIL
jgi:putative endonuclease